MKRLEFDEKNNLANVLKALQKEPENEIEIYLFPGSEILKDSANKEIIELLAKDLNKKLIFKGELGVKPAIMEKSEHEVKGEENHGFVEGKDMAEDQIEGKTPAEKKKGKFSLPRLAKLKKLLKGPKWIYFLIGFLGFVVVGGILTFWLVPKATVTLITEQKFKEAELAIVASAQAEEVDVDKGIIPLKTLETTVEDVLEVKSTGSKTVGTISKGRVKIVNRDTENAKTFFKGTTITSVSGTALSFSLDAQATVSAAPVGCEDCPQTGVDVTAKSIGDSGNLKAGTVFKIGSADINLVFAKSDTNFSGGSSKKIKIVSADDQKKVKEDLLEKLETKAREELEAENPKIVIPDGGLESDIINETYSKKVGEEAADLRLSLEVKFTAKIFSENDLKNILINSISESIPRGFEIDKEGSSVESEILEKSDDDLKVLGKIKAHLIPIIDTSDIAKNIAGKDFGATDKYLKSIDAITGFEIKLEPSIMKLFGTMPFVSSRIKVNVTQEE